MSKTALIICSFNRPQYFARCLNSVKRARFPERSVIIMIDDRSNDIATLKLFQEFKVDGVEIVRIKNARNSKIYFSLKAGFEKAFAMGCDYAINIDSDAIVKPDFMERLQSVIDVYQGHLVTGFNSRNKKPDGTDRHEVIEDLGPVILKRSVGGINFAVDNLAYTSYVLPALEQCIKRPGNWDHMACINAMKDEKPVVCLAPSCIQHIGFESSMGHTEDPDVACDFHEIELPDVTLIGVDCADINRLIKAVDYSTIDIKFADVKILSSIPSKSKSAIQIPPIRSKQAYSQFVIKELHKYFSTSHALIIQHDGYVLNAVAWNEEWLQYDYIGATWWYKDGANVGNGGFSLRSHRLMKLLAEDPQIMIHHPEDDAICRRYRRYLEAAGMVFAPEEVANRFAIEAYNVPAPDNKYGGQFGFHGGHVDFRDTEHSNINSNVRRR